MLKSVRWTQFVGYITFVMLCLIVTAVMAPSSASAAVQTVTVDLNPNNGAPTYRGSGFLYGLSADGSAPAGSLLSDLKPKLFRGGGAGLSGGAWAVGGYNGYVTRFNSILAQYNRVNAIGAKYQILVSDVWGSDGRTIPDNTQPIFPGDNGNWTSWNNFITQLVTDKKANNMSNARYDIWNEPDGAYFWPRSEAQYFEMWKRSVQLIRSLDANAVIVGPGYGGFNANQLSTWLDYAKANNVLPNILDWHFSADPVADVQTAQGLLTAKSITSVSGMTIGEYIWSAQQNAGYTAWYLARLEKSGVLGANHAIWDHCCDQGLLDDILTTSSQKKGQWWAYKSYADMSGTIVGTTASANIDGVASKDATKQSASILLGNRGGETGDMDVNVINLNTAAYLINNGKTHVVVSWINNLDPLAAPVVTQSFDATVVNNAIRVTIPWNYDVDAFTIALTPASASAPGETNLPGKLEAENYSMMNGIQTETTNDTGGGLNVGWTDAGDWMDYPVNVQNTGTYTVGFRVASVNTTGQIQLKNSAGTVLSTVNVPNTGGWQTWTTVNATVNLTAGGQTIRLYVPTGGFNVNWLNFTLNPPTGPVVYQAENAVLAGGAKIMTDHTGFTGTGFVAGYEFQGPSTAFTVNAASQGNYNVELRYANGSGSVRTLSIYVNGTKIKQTSLTNLANWDTWGTKTEVLNLQAGNNTITYKFDAGDSGLVNLDKISVSP
ncbi:hypothetical protein A8709_15530 [Paenibacillus pectinilyticus]|uniref:CBM6 domain-containing protein n=1 Tax=Paenibacillus pectinilyticus TaxID=512399 RepID=A0A1C1A4K8_9BACL|nr:carbohydrate-binding protein [Paenibacillus pectinilyticus]OCT15485.1 hypothetical protein A8709_15530 [Paenibacillus pectinilyticus]